MSGRCHVLCDTDIFLAPEDPASLPSVRVFFHAVFTTCAAQLSAAHTMRSF